MADIIITTTMTAGVTQIQDLAPGAICRGATTLKRSGAEVALMIGAGVQIVIDAMDVTGKRGSGS